MAAVGPADDGPSSGGGLAGMAFAVQLDHHVGAQGGVLLLAADPLIQLGPRPLSGGEGARVEGHKHRVQCWGVRLAGALAGGGDGALADGLGVAGGHAEAVASEGLAQRWPGGAQLSRGGVDAAELFGELEGTFGLGPVDQEAAGLPAHSPLRCRQAPVGEGGGEGVAVDAELAGGLPQPDLASQLVRLLGQVSVPPVGAGLRETSAAKLTALGRQGAPKDAVIVVEPTGGVDGQLQALVADLAGGADGLGLGRLGVLAGLGEEPLGVQITAGGLVQPRLPAAVLDHRDRPLGPLGLGGATVGGAQRPQDLPDSAFADPDQAGNVAEIEALAALGLPQPP